jgi:hypothetical protein
MFVLGLLGCAISSVPFEPFPPRLAVLRLKFKDKDLDVYGDLAVSKIGQQSHDMPLIPVKEYGDNIDKFAPIVPVSFKAGSCNRLSTTIHTTHKNLTGRVLFFDEQKKDPPCSIAEIATAAVKVHARAALIVQNSDSHGIVHHSKIRSEVILASLSVADARRISYLMSSTFKASETCADKGSADLLQTISGSIHISWDSWRAGVSKCVVRTEKNMFGVFQCSFVFSLCDAISKSSDKAFLSWAG